MTMGPKNSDPRDPNNDHESGTEDCRAHPICGCGAEFCLAGIRHATPPVDNRDLFDRWHARLSSPHWSWRETLQLTVTVAALVAAVVVTSVVVTSISVAQLVL
ncbi:hypothetical protein IU449_23220 [Nocardia higoensis]|uniref:Uncharacterized protein n=1 Tax=Nocardia higoensis TaxID=228599 RepID=A0ABS0DHR7_9NOCA|nr:hypothetical protein [Nocardia higoensis]MBF6357423.1 hypothetical protein [Nocardia higoensis]